MAPRISFFRVATAGLLALAASIHPGIAAGGVVALASQDLTPYRDAAEGLREALGEPVAWEALSGEPGADRAALEALATSRPDLVVALGDRAAQAAAERLPGLTVVFGLCVRPPQPPSPASPAMTGVLLDVAADRQLAAFRSAIPGLARIGVIYDPSRSTDQVTRIASATQEAGIDLYTQRVATARDVPSAFRRVAEAIDALWLIPDETALSRASFDYILLESLKRRLPVLVFNEPMVRAGGLMTLAADNREAGRQIGDLAGRVLRAHGRNLPPIEAPAAASLAINLRSARILGLTIPPPVVADAAQVFGPE
ncbi:MAG: hypothetical protein HY049_15245 [Acidobacteria bacterium]|nr:hypothetical protein [Acidobacteriota bacterium]